MKYWRRLVRDLGGLVLRVCGGAGAHPGTGPEGRRRSASVVIVMTPEPWVDMFSVAHGSVDAAFDRVKQTPLALRPDEGFAVCSDYCLEPSTEDTLPEPEVPEPGSGTWTPHAVTSPRGAAV